MLMYCGLLVVAISEINISTVSTREVLVSGKVYEEVAEASGHFNRQ